MTDIQNKMKEGQHTTSGIKHWGLSCYASVLPRIKVCCRVIVTCSAIPNDFIPPTVMFKRINSLHFKLKKKVYYVEQRKNQ